MSDPKQPELPELHQSELDPDTLEALFADLEACAEIHAVIPKAGPGHVTPASITLAEGRALLTAGQLRGLQIRYRYQGSEWWDTLIAVGGAVRITRIEQTYGESGA